MTRNNINTAIEMYNTRHSDTDTIDMAKIITFSVLKKVYKAMWGACVKDGATEWKTKVSWGKIKTVGGLRVDLMRDLNNAECLPELIDVEKYYYINSNGDVVEKYHSEVSENIANILKDCISDSMDLLHVAVVALIEEDRKQMARGEERDILAEYERKKLSKMVIIGNTKPVTITETTSPMREVYRAVRRAIMANQSMQTASNVYTYIDELTASGHQVYRRLPKYSSLATVEVRNGYNGTRHYGNITTDRESVKKIEKLIEKMGLTDKQATVIKYRLCGYGVEKIADTCGVCKKSVQDTLKQVQVKAQKIGLHI